MYIVSIVGAHNVGKTMYCESLIRRAKSDGFKVAAMKSSSSSLDMESTDTKRLMNAGAEHVVFASPSETVLFLRLDAPAERLFDRFHLYPDLLLIEGYKSGGYPKFLIARDESDLNLEVQPETVKAVVCPAALHTLANRTYPQALLFDAKDFEPLYQRLRELYIEQYASNLPDKDCRKCGFTTCKDYANALRRGEAKPGGCPRIEAEVRVSVDGDELVLSPYPRRVLSSVIGSLIETLSGVPVKYKSIDVLIREPSA